MSKHIKRNDKETKHDTKRLARVPLSLSSLARAKKHLELLQCYQ